MDSLFVIVCTLGRSEIFINSINSIAQYNTKNYEIVIVDNNKEGLSSGIIRRIKKMNNVLLIHESNSGLSIARNRGVASLSKEWVLFLDDDIKLPPSFFDKLERILNEDRYDCFGGMYYPFYPLEKPKWLPDTFGEKTPLSDSERVIDVHKDGFLSAGIFCVKHAVLSEIGGFRTDIGMGRGIGYGEEDDLQIRLQAAGYKIGFVPNWWLYHAVLPHKYKVRWHLKSAFARGRDGQKVHGKWSKVNASLFLLKGFVGMTLRGGASLRKILSRKDYYWENGVVDTFGPFFNICGRFAAAFFID